MEEYSKSTEQRRKSFQEQFDQAMSEIQARSKQIDQSIARSREQSMAEMQKQAQQSPSRANSAEFERRIMTETEIQKSNTKSNLQIRVDERATSDPVTMDALSSEMDEFSEEEMQQMLEMTQSILKLQIQVAELQKQTAQQNTEVQRLIPQIAQTKEFQNQVPQQIAQAIATEMHRFQQQTTPRIHTTEFEIRSTAETEVERRSSFETGNNQSSRNLKCDLKLEFSKFEVSTTIAPEMFDESPKKGKLEVVIESELKDKIGEKNYKSVYEVVGEVYEVHDIGLEVALDAVSYLVETGEEVVDRYDLYCGSDRLLAQLILKTGVVVNHHTTELGEVASSTGPWIKLVRLELHNIEATNISEMDILIFDPGGADSIPNLHSIIAASDGAMVARGDLGAELPVVEVTLLQVEIIRWCRSMGKAVIVATNMLESMIFHPTPNRVEVSDIAIAGFSVITPANIQQILVVLLGSLGNALHISEKVSGAIYYLARGYEDTDTSSSMLTLCLLNIIKCLFGNADRTDGGDSKLRSAAYKTLSGDAADQIMILFLMVFGYGSFTVHAEAMLAIVALAYATGQEFVKYMQELYSYLEMDLQIFEDYHVCSISVGVIGDICCAVNDKILPYYDGIMTHLLNDLSSSELHRSVKSISDYYIAASARFVNQSLWQRVIGVAILHYSYSKKKATNPLPAAPSNGPAKSFVVKQALSVRQDGKMFGVIVMTTPGLFSIMVQQYLQSWGQDYSQGGSIVIGAITHIIAVWIMGLDYMSWAILLVVEPCLF